MVYSKVAPKKKNIWCSFLRDTHQHHVCNSAFSGICLLPKAVTFPSLPTFQNRPILPPTWWLALTCFSALLKCDPSSYGYEGSSTISLWHSTLTHLFSHHCSRIQWIKLQLVNSSKLQSKGCTPWMNVKCWLLPEPRDIILNDINLFSWNAN